MREVRSGRSMCFASAVVVAVLMVLSDHASPMSAQSAASSISSTSGAAQWDYAAVVAGQVTNLGVQDVCPPALCDNHDLTVVLPSPAATFYQTMTATLTIKFTWTSSAPTDIDIFAVSPSSADHGPGAPDGLFTGPGEETLTLTDPVDGLWHIRSMAALSPLPTSAHAVATLTVAAKPTAPVPAPAPNGAPTFVNYAAPEDCPSTIPPSSTPPPPNCMTPALGSTTAGGHG